MNKAYEEETYTFYENNKNAYCDVDYFPFISPFFIMISTSLKEFTEITKWPPTWIPDVLRWENYRDVWSEDSNIRRPFFNSLIVSISTMVLCTVLGSFAAYGVSRFRFVGKKSFYS